MLFVSVAVAADPRRFQEECLLAKGRTRARKNPRSTPARERRRAFRRLGKARDYGPGLHRTIEQTRLFSHPVLWRDSRPNGCLGLDEHGQAGLLTSGSTYRLRLTAKKDFSTAAFEAFVARYSGATVRDFHPLPYSPRTVVQGTCQWMSPNVTKTFQRTSETLGLPKESRQCFSDSL